MNKAVSFFMAILALVVMIPMAAFAQGSNTSTAKGNETTEKNYDQGIREVELDDGTIVKVGFSSTEYSSSIMPKSGCANGNHTSKHYYGTVDATRIHQAAASHPCYCTVVYSQDWQCSACNSQTASPFGCMSNFYFKILSNFWGSLQRRGDFLLY